jgi:hypothetical protein
MGIMDANLSSIFQILLQIIISTIGGVLAGIIWDIRRTPTNSDSSFEKDTQNTTTIAKNYGLNIHGLAVFSMLISIFLITPEEDLLSAVVIVMLAILPSIILSYISCAIIGFYYYKTTEYINKYFWRGCYSIYFSLLIILFFLILANR